MSSDADIDGTLISEGHDDEDLIIHRHKQSPHVIIWSLMTFVSTV